MKKSSQQHIALPKGLPPDLLKEDQSLEVSRNLDLDFRENYDHLQTHDKDKEKIAVTGEGSLIEPKTSLYTSSALKEDDDEE